MRSAFKLAAGVAMSAIAVVSQAADIKPAVIYDIGGKFDRSFNQASYTGAQTFKEETGIDYVDFEMTNEAQREQVMLRFAQRGRSPIVVTGFQQAPIVEKMATQFPDTDFVLIDSVVDLPNVRSVVFKEHEGSFLVGALAAMKSENQAVGFIGGMDVPLIRNFGCGFEQGAAYVNEDIKLMRNMTGTTPAAWNDPTRGGELARAQFENDVDVVFAAAGGTGVGIMQAAADAGKMGIGVDSNQNYLHPGSMLTSMLKRVDVAVNTALTDAMNGEFTGGVQNMGLAEDGVGWALDEHNRPLLSEEDIQHIEDIRAKVIAGDIEVYSYQDNPAGCNF